jgi:hypothetical protein
MQCSFLTEEKQKNQLAQTEFHFTKNDNKNKGGEGGGVITRRPPPSHQRCTAAKDGKLQGGLFQQNYAAECMN